MIIIIIIITFPALSFCDPSQYMSLRLTSLIRCVFSSTGSSQYVSRSHSSSIGFHSDSIQCLYQRSSQSHFSGLPNYSEMYEAYPFLILSDY